MAFISLSSAALAKADCATVLELARKQDKKEGLARSCQVAWAPHAKTLAFSKNKCKILVVDMIAPPAHVKFLHSLSSLFCDSFCNGFLQLYWDYPPFAQMILLPTK